jgi:hypothetical protein
MLADQRKSRTSNCWQKKKTYDLYLTAMTTLMTSGVIVYAMLAAYR